MIKTIEGIYQDGKVELAEQRREIYQTASEWINDNLETLERCLVESI